MENILIFAEDPGAANYMRDFPLFLKEMGFNNVANANGGFDSLKKVGLPIVQKEKK